MRKPGKGADCAQATLLDLLRYEESLQRWESLPPEARQEAVEQLARMMLRTVAGGGGDEAGDADPVAAS